MVGKGKLSPVKGNLVIVGIAVFLVVIDVKFVAYSFYGDKLLFRVDV